MSSKNELLQEVEDRALQMMKADQGLHGMSRTEIFLLWGCLLTKTRIELESHPLRSTDSEQLPEVGPLGASDALRSSGGPLQDPDDPNSAPKRRGPGRPKREG